jgi:protein-arginine kinase activator protein McsA
MAKHQKPAKEVGKRRINVRDTRKVILVVCEGTKTEPNYFEDMGKHLRINTIVEIDGTGRNTRDLVNHASSRKSEDFDEIWCVFDKDDFSDNDFNSAIQKAEQQEVCVAYSNECFELWYVLHYNYHTTSHKRDHYCKNLNSLTGERYEKGSVGMYYKLLEKLPKAIKHAQRLTKEHKGKTPARANPSTTVHLLVQRLQEIAKKQELN